MVRPPPSAYRKVASPTESDTPRRSSFGSMSRTMSSESVATTTASTERGQHSLTDVTNAESRTRLAKVCKKLAIHGKAEKEGARYTLYMHIEMPELAKPRSYPLFPDKDVTLLQFSIDKLTSSGAAPMLSSTAAIAASRLNMKLGAGGVDDEGPDAQSQSLKVTTANYHICLNAAATASAPTGDETAKKEPVKQGYLVILHLRVPFTAQPPQSPFVVRLPMPRCLNNKLRFDLNPEIFGSDGIIADVQPGTMRPSKSRPTSAGVGGHGEDGTAVIQGPFPSTADVIIRWEGPTKSPLLSPTALQAGMADTATSEGLRCLGTEKMTSTLRVSAVAEPPDDLQQGEAAIAIAFQAELVDPHFVGLDSKAAIELRPDVFGQAARWHEVDVLGSAGLLRWARIGSESSPDGQMAKSSSRSSLHSVESSDGSLKAAMSSNPFGGSGGTDESMLMDMQIPSGITQSDMDFSIDEQPRSEGGLSRPGRRLSIGVRQHQQDIQACATAGDGEQTGLVLVFDVNNIRGRDASASTPLSISVHGILIVSTFASPDLWKDNESALEPASPRALSIPVFRTKCAETHSSSVTLANVKDAPNLTLLRCPAKGVKSSPSSLLADPLVTDLFSMEVSSTSPQILPALGCGWDVEHGTLAIETKTFPDDIVDENQVRSGENISLDASKQGPLEPASLRGAEVHAPLADLSTDSAVSTGTILSMTRKSSQRRFQQSTDVDAIGAIVEEAKVEFWPTYSPGKEPQASANESAMIAVPDPEWGRMVVRLNVTWPTSLPTDDDENADSATAGSLTPALLCYLPPEAQILHASIAGLPLRVAATAAAGGRSALTELQLSSYLYARPDESQSSSPLRASIVYETSAAQELVLPTIAATTVQLAAVVALPAGAPYRCSSSDLYQVSNPSSSPTFHAFMLGPMSSRKITLIKDKPVIPAGNDVPNRVAPLQEGFLKPSPEPFLWSPAQGAASFAAAAEVKPGALPGHGTGSRKSGFWTFFTLGFMTAILCVVLAGFGHMETRHDTLLDLINEVLLHVDTSAPLEANLPLWQSGFRDDSSPTHRNDYFLKQYDATGAPSGANFADKQFGLRDDTKSSTRTEAGSSLHSANSDPFDESQARASHSSLTADLRGVLPQIKNMAKREHGLPDASRTSSGARPSKRRRSDGAVVGDEKILPRPKTAGYVRRIAGPGIYVSTIRGKEKRAADELVQLLEEIVARDYPGASVEPGWWPQHAVNVDDRAIVDQAASKGEREEVALPPSKTGSTAAPSGQEERKRVEAAKSDDVETRFARELAALEEEQSGRCGSKHQKAGVTGEQGAKGNAFFRVVDTGAECLRFLSVAAPLCPFALSFALLKNVEDTGHARCRFVQRITPVAASAHASALNIAALAKHVLPRWLPEEADAAKTFKIDTRIRNHTTLQRDEVIETLAAQIPRTRGHKVDLNNPDCWIVFECLKGTCHIGVLEGYMRFAKYNPQQLADVVRSRRAQQDASAETSQSLQDDTEEGLSRVGPSKR
ncbi:THUMP domain-containing proteins [Ceraceosorus bombacis]|uniref:THUMP domain-containing proteins n=1 Tax=Ceraceosorus bombacis TaxID=401625 RepID=A0A0P1B809_9BASI|nr:THUMP domain-containing proteins [Ceraceosorus bombacis]